VVVLGREGDLVVLFLSAGQVAVHVHAHEVLSGLDDRAGATRWHGEVREVL
jgi:hypothetical protein